MMKIAKLFFLLFIFPAFLKGQQTTDRGIVYYTLGNDTTVIQYFEYSNHQYKTTFLQFTGAITKCEATGILDEKGDIKKVSSVNSRINDKGEWELVSRGENNFTGDSSIYTAANDKGEIVYRRSFPGNGIVANGMDIASFYNFAYMGFYAPVKNGDTLFHRQLSFNGFRKYIVSRKSKNEIRIGSNLMGYISLMVDDKNYLQKIEGVGSSLNIKATVDRVNTDVAILDNIAKRRNANGTAAVRTLRDTAVIVLNDGKIEVDYWRPHKRGREIFGNVVPWNRIWRTGANNATQLRISRDIIIGGNKLAAGKYGIWSYPTETKWDLLINKNASNWGTDYDAAADILKLPLKIERSDIPVEVLKISLTKKDNSTATLTIEWDTYKGSIDITTN